MTKSSNLSKSNSVNDIVLKIVDAKQNIVKNFLIIGACLDKIQVEKLWSHWGSHLKTFDDFLKEIKMGRSTGYYCLDIWREFGVMLKSKNLDIDYSRLVKLLPVVNEKNKDEWLTKAESLSNDDFDDELRVAKGKESRLDCRHEWEDWQKCKKCLIIRKKK